MNQSETSATTIVTSADSQTRTTSTDVDGDGVIDAVQVAETTADAGGAVTTTTTTFDGAGDQRLGSTASTLSADGLSKITQVDLDGDGVVDRTTTDFTTTNDRGGQTEDVTVKSADGTVLSEVLTARGTDGVSRNTATYDGSGNVLASDEIGGGPQGGTFDRATDPTGRRKSARGRAGRTNRMRRSSFYSCLSEEIETGQEGRRVQPTRVVQQNCSCTHKTEHVDQRKFRRLFKIFPAC